MEKKTKLIVAALISYMVTVYLPYIMKVEKSAYSNSFFSVMFGMMNFYIIYNFVGTIDWKKKRELIWSAIPAIILSATLVFGKQLDTIQNVDFLDINMWTAIIAHTSYFTIIIIKLFEAYGRAKWFGNGEATDKKTIFLTWLGIILMWMPVFLALYPGAFIYDAQEEYVQVATREFTTHHPLLHVLLLGGSVVGGNKFLGSYNVGIAIYTLSQMAVLAGCFTYLLVFLKKYGVNKNIRVISYLVVGLFPVFPMFAVCSAKDVLFTAALMVVFILLLEYYLDNSQFKKIRYNLMLVVVSVVMMLFRNNGMYAYAVLALMVIAITLLQYKKGGRENVRLSILKIVSIVLFLLVSNLMIWALNADNSKKQEILTVPIQQITRTYNFNEDSFSEEQKKILYEVLPEEVLEKYSPNISDPVKINFDSDMYSKDPGKYHELWLEMGIRNPSTYINAWLLTSYGNWYPDTIINVYKGQQRFTYKYEDSSYFGFETEPPGTRESKLPWLEKFYRKLSLEVYQQNIPVVSMLFSPGFLFYIYLLIACYIVMMKDYRKLVPLLLVGLIWATLLLGPTYLVRYLIMFWFLLPVVMVLPHIRELKK